MEHIAELDGIVTGFNVTEQCIDYMCSKDLIKIDKHSRDIICQKTVFEKEGLSRKLIADDERIFIYDFCTLYILNQKNYELIGKWQLGNDLSSDICGTVDGKLLLLYKSTLSVVKNLVLGKKNIGSLYIDGDTLYAASHDGKLFKICIKNFEIETSTKNVHKKMFVCAGIYKNMLITVSYPCSEIALWNKDTLEKIKVINIPLKLSGRTHIEDNFMYISSRNILGIDRINLDE